MCGISKCLPEYLLIHCWRTSARTTGVCRNAPASFGWPTGSSMPERRGSFKSKKDQTARHRGTAAAIRVNRPGQQVSPIALSRRRPTTTGFSTPALPKACRIKVDVIGTVLRTQQDGGLIVIVDPCSQRARPSAPSSACRELESRTCCWHPGRTLPRRFSPIRSQPPS